ncbi:DUF3592 domain-containing protein [Streptomyces sp. NPDC004822]|uniref:DUF3592 domain-containing protein n=1 Tax=Streptomyces sp. SS1-1 TaxID=2651869 RepID=UPI001CEF81D5|nr:DUF3592 domain-containing protein [Streptomyces sp. SS1-1]
MDALFYVVPCLVLGVALFIGFRLTRRAWQIRAAWNSGLTAEGRCLRTFTTTHGGGGETSVHTTLHHVYEFTARDGRVVRFEEEDGPATTVVGDFVTVHYTEGARIAATARRPGRVRLAASTLGVLAVLAVIAVTCVTFLVSYQSMSSEFGFGEDTGDAGDTVVVDGVTMTP